MKNRLCLFALLLVAATVTGCGNWGAPSAEQTAAAMVESLRTYAPNMGSPPAPAADRHGLLDALMEREGRSLSPNQRVMLAAQAWTWLDTRWLLNQGQSRGVYPARLRAVDGLALDQWQTQNARLELGLLERPVLVLALIFQDKLWDGGAPRPGQPAAALRRLSSLTPQQVTAWTSAASAAPDPVFAAERFMAAYSLIGVDELFAENVIQPDRFEAALVQVPAALAALRASRQKQ